MKEVRVLLVEVRLTSREEIQRGKEDGESYF